MNVIIEPSFFPGQEWTEIDQERSFDCGQCGIVPMHGLARWRSRRSDKRVVVTNGVFDAFHGGHADLLIRARELGDVLLVGLNSDRSARQLRGLTVAWQPWQLQRAELLLALRSVDAVCIFDQPQATAFLQEALPTIYVKGENYTIDALDPDERQMLLELGSDIRFIPFRWRSTPPPGP